MTYIPECACSVLNDYHIKLAVQKCGCENIHFGKLWLGFNATENEFIFSYAASKFQHLMDFESL